MTAHAANPRLIFFVNDAAFFASHRLPIALEARRRGFAVSVICPPSPDVEQLDTHGIRHHPVELPRGRISPLAEIRAWIRVFGILLKERPDLVHLITSKPIIYGGIAARILKIPAVAAVSGLGHVFSSETLHARMLRILALFGYRLALRRRGSFPIFQNTENLSLFKAEGICFEQPTLVRGSGTDLTRFDARPRQRGDTVRFVLPARMLTSKGVREFVEAAAILRAEGAAAEFWLAGDPDPANPTSLTQAQLRAWHDEGLIRWLGHRSDIEAVLAECDVVVFPSYNEGLPKTLVDAAAAGRAVITTDVVGCRDAVVANETALIVPPRDSGSLAAAMRALIVDPDLRDKLGRAGRGLADRAFAIETIVSQHLALFERILGREPARK